MCLSENRRVKGSGQAALNRLLPLLLPGTRVKVTSFQAEILGSSRWADLACQLGLAPAFYTFLRQGEQWNLLSSAVQEQLEAAFRENLANSMAMENVLTAILGVFRTMGTVPVLLKGLAFATELYPDPAARFAGDIDLLVAPEQKEEAILQLEKAGCRLVSQSPAQPGKLKSLLRPAGERWGLARADDGGDPEDDSEAAFLTRVAGQDILIEVHSYLINLRAGGGKAEVFRSRDEGQPASRPLRLAAGEVRVLDYQTAFLHALRHVALHHRLIGHRWHHDLALMLVHWEKFLDAGQIRRRCRELNSEKILNVELAVLEDLFGPDIFSGAGRARWSAGSLPWEYPLYCHVARGGTRTPLRELVRTLLAPCWREQLRTLT
jgi:hypothetical protein